MSWVVVHPSGNTFVRALLAHLEKEQLLDRFITGAGFARSGVAGRVLGRWPQALRRSYDLPPARLKAAPLREAGRLGSGVLGLKRFLAHETGVFCVDAVYRAVDRAGARWLSRVEKKPGVVHAYEDGALETFRTAAKCGVLRSYELPIAYWEFGRRLLEFEAAKRPNWAHTLVGTDDSEAKCERKSREIRLADVVVCPSRFVADSLPSDVRASVRVQVAPFGTPRCRSEQAQRAEPGPLRVLFAGSMTQRKGLADVFDAFKMLNSKAFELVVLGTPVGSMEFYRREYAAFRHEPSRPHHEVLALMDQCDLLVLPSVVEGRALVQQEAMSRSLPILVTRNAGGEDLVDQGITGWLVPVGAPERIAEHLEWCAMHQSNLREMGRSAQKRAADYSWAGYAESAIAAALTCQRERSGHNG